MSKKFTSFLVLVTALLLTVPTHAQLAKKQSKAQVSAFKTNILKPADLAKAKEAKLKATASLKDRLSVDLPLKVIICRPVWIKFRKTRPFCRSRWSKTLRHLMDL